MVLFSILLLMLLILLTITVIAISIGGSGMILVFGDVIVCMIFIVLAMRWLVKRKRK